MLGFSSGNGSPFQGGGRTSRRRFDTSQQEMEMGTQESLLLALISLDSMEIGYLGGKSF